MTRRGVMGLFAGVAVGGVLAGCGSFFANRYRFRMTVEVQTPQGIKTGSAVYEVWATTNTARILPEEHARDWGVKGEALVIDLPTGPVFALMKTADSMRSDLALMSMGALDPTFKNDAVESAGRIAGSWLKRSGDVVRADWPLMVRFRDINDPKSVEPVEPEAIGVRRIQLETTSDAVTTGIDKKLQWLALHRGSLTSRLSSPDPTNPPLSARITEMDFSSELPR